MAKPTVLARHYWDACLFIDLINKTTGRERVLLDLLDDLAKQEPTEIAVTSVLTIAEVSCAKAEREAHQLDGATLDKMNAFWAPDSPIELVEVYPALALDARAIIREVCARGKKITPYDALHFATAKKRGVQTFLTYDKALLKLDNWFGFRVRQPKSDKLAFDGPIEAPRAR